MTTLPVNRFQSRKRLDVGVFLAFFAIYVIWGSTFLAIRTVVLLEPPWFCAGVRFFTAGMTLLVWARLRGGLEHLSPTAREWWSLSAIGALMFAVTYGALFWGEQFVPSGITSVLEATIPLFTVLAEVFVLRQQRFRWRVLVALGVGFLGVAVMVFKGSLHISGRFGILPVFVILGGAMTWSLGAALTRSLPLPKSRIVTAGAAMSIGGVVLLLLSLLTGELHPFPRMSAKAVFALMYLIVAGSLVGFTAFVYLLGKMPASRVASHAYVNPVVAIALGYFVASEEITLRTLAGALLVVGSVVLTLREG